MVLVLTPLLVFYYHFEVKIAVHAQENRMLHSIIEIDFSALFLSSWWHESPKGQRNFILPTDTVSWFEEGLQYILIEPDTRYGKDGQNRVLHIIRAMYRGMETPTNDLNNLRFPETELSPCQFVCASNYLGIKNTHKEGDQRLECGRKHGGRMYETGVEPDENDTHLGLTEDVPPQLQFNITDRNKVEC